MQHIEIRMVFSEMSELTNFVNSMPPMALRVAAPAATLQVAHEPSPAPQALPAPKHNGTATVQHQQPANQPAAPAPVHHHTPVPAPTADIATINRVMRQRLEQRDASGKQTCPPEVIRGLFERYGAQIPAQIPPAQLDNFLFELQNL